MRARLSDAAAGPSPSPSPSLLDVRVGRRGLQSAAAGLFLLLGVCGCAPSATARAGENGSRTANASPSISTVVPDDTPAPHDQEKASSPSPSAGTNSLATAAMRSFCHPERSRQAWIAGLDPYLTLAAASAYATVQPSRVDCTRVIATAHSGEGDDFTQLVTVPTDAGLYHVTVTRASASERWLVFRIALVTAQ